LITGREDYPADLRGTVRTAKTRASGQVGAPWTGCTGGQAGNRVADFDAIAALAGIEILGIQDLAA
jgi:hypothetical protein